MTGKELRELREELQLSVKELAKKAKVTETSIYTFEAGKSVPRKKTMEQICEALGIQYEEPEGEVYQEPVTERSQPKEEPCPHLQAPEGIDYREMFEILDNASFQAVNDFYKAVRQIKKLRVAGVMSDRVFAVWIEEQLEKVKGGEE